MGSCQSKGNVVERPVPNREVKNEKPKASESRSPTPPNSIEPPVVLVRKEELTTESPKPTASPGRPVAPPELDSSNDAKETTIEKAPDIPDDTSNGSNGSDGSDGSDGSNGSSGSSKEGSLKNSLRNCSIAGNGDKMKHSGSVIGLDTMIETRKEEGDLKSNVVHIEVPFGKPIEEVYSGVHTGPVLGSGISGLVRLATHLATGVKYAVKCLDLGFVETEEGLQQLREEIYIMCQLDHPNIVRLEEVYESHSEIYLVQELCLGGELFDRLDEQPDYHYTEQQCARLVKQMLSSVRYIHSKGIVHRDLKLENFLFSTTSPDSELKMIDFGLSKHFTRGETHHEAVGTPYTVAPEVIRGGYDEKCDVWAIGVITFLLLSGDPPFGGCGGPEPLTMVRANILKGSFNFEPEDIWYNVSQQARDFITSLLVISPANRPNAEEAQKSLWLQEWANCERKLQKGAGQLNPNVVKALVSFKEYSDMRKLLCEVLSFTLLPDQIKDLRTEFEKMDTEGSGEISLNSLKKVLMENAGAGSLGALTEEEVEDIFNAMRVGKTETTIQWHEFIAAGLSQCSVDDRNLRLAFDRLDSDHKGYISFDDVLDLMGSDATEETLRIMYQDSLKTCRSQHARITYEDFLLLMKGQTREGFIKGEVQHSPVVSSRKQRMKPENEFSLDGSPKMSVAMPLMPSLMPVTSLARTEGDMSAVTSMQRLEMVREVSSSVEESDKELKDANAIPLSTGGQVVSVKAPLLNVVASTVPKSSSYFIDQNMDTDPGPLSFDDDDKNVSPNVKLAMNHPESPQATAQGLSGDPVTPPRSVAFIDPEENERLQLSAPNRMITRMRSKSVGEENEGGDEGDDRAYLLTPVDSRRCVVLPEHAHDNAAMEGLIKDKTRTPLVVNRELYRAHRRMRLAVLEASKRFEEKQMTRAQLQLLHDRSNGNTYQNAGMAPAGLVMRRGHKKELSSKSVRLLLQQEQNVTQNQVEQVVKRSGRGRRNRKKTVSDIHGMFGSPQIPDSQTKITRGDSASGTSLESSICEKKDNYADKSVGNGGSLKASLSDGKLNEHVHNSPSSPPTITHKQDLDKTTLQTTASWPLQTSL